MPPASLRENGDPWLAFACPPKSETYYRERLQDVAASFLFCAYCHDQYAVPDGRETAPAAFARVAPCPRHAQSAGWTHNHGIAWESFAAHRSGDIAAVYGLDAPYKTHRSGDTGPANHIHG